MEGKKRLVGNVIEADPVDNRLNVVKRRDGRLYNPSNRRKALFRDSQGRELAPDEWPKVSAIAICRFEGCPVNGRHTPCEIGENVDGVYRVSCGGCGQAIEEVWVDEAYTPLPLDPEEGQMK